MDEAAIGRVVRALRHRVAWRQQDVAARAGVSQDAVSLLERGQMDRLSLRLVRRIARALDAEIVVSVRWRGGELDRLMDEGHAALVEAAVRILERYGWAPAPEVSFSVYGERGSIDVLAWHAESRTLLVIEVKTAVVSVEETLRRHDAKTRLAARIALERFGWDARAVGRILVLPDASTPRRHTARHGATFAKAYPARGREVSAWLRRPVGALAGLLFMSQTTVLRGRRRIRGRGRLGGASAARVRA